MIPAPPPSSAGSHADLVASIGHTPTVRLQRLAPSPRVELWAKLEAANPTGSLKDRVARAMLDDALASGVLQPGQTILEPSSGNTGISLAMLGARLGHPVRIVMPDNTTPGADAAAAAVRRGDRLLARARKAATARSGWPRS